MKLRAGTTDQCVYDEVIERNCYRVPDSLAGHTVIDIGAHIGCFSKLCLERGARVVAFELEPENFEIAKENLHDYIHPSDRLSPLKIFNLAVWKRKQKIGRSGMYRTADLSLQNTGSSHVVLEAGPHAGADAIDTITLDEILDEFNRVFMVKIDAEGAEFEIVPATKSWEKVDRLVGEVHGYRKEYSRPEFYTEVKKWFPALEVISYCPEYGLETFFATR